MSRLITMVQTAFEVYSWLIIIRVVLSWMPHDPYKPVFRFIYEVTEPALAPFRRLRLGRNMGIDFAPFFALIALYIVERMLLRLLFMI